MVLNKWSYGTQMPPLRTSKSVGVYHKEFKITPQDVGNFEISKINHAFCADARTVDQDWKVSVQGGWNE